ncbi:hypothetical protein [Spiroplasma endosymbiont of Amphibalanus improvisus]|uniref:hypothetical protein n=1 Tax=Spiroplasma endosymbiont of Amphibalanus improvisus TaxID=3066327 RepID=UPI00313CCF0C
MLKENNELILNKIVNDIDLDKISNQMIISVKEFQTAEYIISKIVNNIFCLNKNRILNCNCHVHNKISKNILSNIIVTGDYENLIKKEEIIKSINIFSMTTITKSEKKIYIIKGAELLTSSAANSLLKFLEEPPLNTYIILVTLNEGKILETINSRCIKFRFIKNDINSVTYPNSSELTNMFLKNLSPKNIVNNYILINDVRTKNKNEINKFLQEIINNAQNFIFKEILLETQINISKNQNKNLSLYNMLFKFEKELIN